MLLVIDDGMIGVGPEPSGGVSIKISHEKLPFDLFIPLPKDRAVPMRDAMTQILSDLVVTSQMPPRSNHGN